MKQGNKGFTLVEMMVAMSVMVVISIGAIAIFARSLRSSTSIETQQRRDETAKNIIDNLTRLLRDAKVVTVDGHDYIYCLNSGPVNVTNKALVFKTLDSTTLATITLETDGTGRGYIASNSATMNAANVDVSNFNTTWTCSNGQPDKLDMGFSLRMVAVSGYDVDVNLPVKTYNFSVVLRNERK